MDEQNHSQQAASEEEQTPETQPYVPRPKWQIAAAWFFLLVMVLATILYYYWIAYRY